VDNRYGVTLNKSDRAGDPPRPLDEALWEEFAVPVRAFVGRRVPPGIDVDDVVQEVFLRIVRHLPLLEEVERLDAWVFQAARSAVTDALRAHARRRARGSDIDADTLPAAVEDDSPGALAELTPCLVPFLRRLEEPYRSALEMTSLGGLTQHEAAERAGISVSGMKSRVQRARQQLRRLMESCCAVDLDAAGGVMDYEVRDASACGPAPVRIGRRRAT
jgi:RNA polymerase sigma-70 factor, ECF subfamily